MNAKWRTAILAANVLLAGIHDVFAAPTAPTLRSPYNAQVGLPTSSVNFIWNASGYNPTYRIVISQNSVFGGFIDNGGSSTCNNGTCFTIATTAKNYYKSLNCSGHTYYWKVRTSDSTGTSPWSSVWSFKTYGSDSCIPTAPLSSSYMGNLSATTYGTQVSTNSFHTGQDIGTIYSNPSVYAVDGGTVVLNSTNSTSYATLYRKYWNGFVIIKHDSGFFAYYGHLNSLLSVGNRIDKGAVIGTIRNAYKCNIALSLNGECRASSTSDSSILNTSNNHLHISISTSGWTTGSLSGWITSGWGYQPTLNDVYNKFVNPRSYIGL